MNEKDWCLISLLLDSFNYLFFYILENIRIKRKEEKVRKRISLLQFIKNIYKK